MHRQGEELFCGLVGRIGRCGAGKLGVVGGINLGVVWGIIGVVGQDVVGGYRDGGDGCHGGYADAEIREEPTYGVGACRTGFGNWLGWRSRGGGSWFYGGCLVGQNYDCCCLVPFVGCGPGDRTRFWGELRHGYALG